MTAREELIEKIGDIVYDSTGAVDDESALMIAAEIVDLALPQVRTAAELEGYDPDSVLISPVGAYTRVLYADENDFKTGPLTVVWQPEVTA